MNDFEQIRAVKKAAQTRLLLIPGVHAVGIGAKYVGGQNTAEPAIIVFVVKKKPLSELSPHEAVPPEIDGVKTDVIEMPEPEIHVDQDQAKYRPLDGGVQVRAGLVINGRGTLGCIALTEDASKVFAITCQHVFTLWRGKQTDLIAAVSPDQRTLTFSGSNTVGSLVVLQMSIMPVGPGPSQDVELLWVTDNTDTPATVASKVASGINGLGNSRVSSTATGVQVAITWGSNSIVLVPSCVVYDVRSPDPSSNLHASIAANVITLSGRVSEENYGVYTNVHMGGDQPSFGVFTSLTRGDTLPVIATSIADTVKAHIPGVTASASGEQISITGAQAIECIITSDSRVGQPDNDFYSECCAACCGDRIGHVVDGRLDIDVALVQLDPGLKYKADIEEIGAVSGTYQVTEPDAISGTYAVKKRGRTTRLTSGVVQAIDVDGDISITDVPASATTPAKQLFHRHYTGALFIMSVTSTPPFSDGGDSGSAVVNASREVVGILFGGAHPDPPDPSKPSWGLVTPIDPTTTALKIRIATAPSPGIVQTVPTPAGAHAMPAPVGIPALAMTANSVVERNAVTPFTNIGERLRVMEREITATPVGEQYAELVRRHFSEVNTLVNRNRRVAAVWQRNGGPQLIQRLIQMLQHPSEVLQIEIDGKPLEERLAKIQEILTRYGSPSLSADLRKFGPGLGKLAGLTYPQILTTLQT